MNPLEIKGKYNSCIVYNDNCDEQTVSQLFELMNQEFVKGEKIRIMPDCHAGAGCVIGTTMTLTNKKVCPNLVGVDIGCGMLACKIMQREIDFAKLDNVIREKIPCGTNVREKEINAFNLFLNYIKAKVDISYAKRSVGTLGGGNHFIEVDIDKDGYYWIVIHSGSRRLGKEVCKYYQDLAYEKLKEKENGKSYKDLSSELIEKLKKEGRSKEISKQLEILSQKYKNTRLKTPKDLAYLEGKYFDDYIIDMEIVQDFARKNRLYILNEIVGAMGFTIIDRIETIHNYIDTKNFILRKGSVSATHGEYVIIPMNMRDGSLICIGKGNDEWNKSAPHGAGRLFSRAEAKELITLDEFKKSMNGIFSTSVCESTIDESPMAYKPMEDILKYIKDTVEVVDIIKPVYNFKAN